MVTLIEQLIAKMGLHDEPMVLEKTTELVRLLELRSVNVPLQVNEYGKIVLCADIAAALLSIACDKEQVLKLSGLRKTHYAKHKRMFEKLLELNRIMGINEICIQLGVNEISSKAHELLELYKCIVADATADVDMSHPQYAAMAVYQAGKILKKKIAKTKIMSFSNLRPTQWQDLEQRWNKFLAKHYNNAMDAKLSKPCVNGLEKDQATDAVDKKKHIGRSNQIEIEDYEIWKNRMLAMAESKLKQQQNESEQMEKENIVLSCS